LDLLLLSLYFHPAFRYGGPVASTWELSRGLAARGVKVTVATTDAHGAERLAVPRGFQEVATNLSVRYFRRLPFSHGPLLRGRGELLAPAWALALPGLVARARVVHVSGLMVWALPEVLLLCRLTGKPLVVSPRGMLLTEALAAKAGKKGPFLALLRLLGLSRTVLLHATSEEEVEACRRHLPGARIALVPNGVEVPAEETLRELTSLPSPPALPPPPYLLYLGRLHPHKRLGETLEAFARATEDRPEVHLVLAGDGEEGYRRGLLEKARELGLGSRAVFAGQVEGTEKARLLARAEGLILASRSENFGISVAEALAHGTPAVVARTAPWSGLTEHGCGFWVEGTAAGVGGGIRRLLDLEPEERRAMGGRGRAWMQKELAWDRIAERMEELYQSLLPGSLSAEIRRAG